MPAPVGMRQGLEHKCSKHAVFASRPRPFPKGNRECYGLRPALPQHSPTCTAVPRTSVYRRGSPSNLWEAVRKSHYFHVESSRACLPQQILYDAWVAPAFALVAPPYLPLHHMEDCTRNIGYGIVKVRERLCKKSSHRYRSKKAHFEMGFSEKSKIFFSQISPHSS